MVGWLSQIVIGIIVTVVGTVIAQAIVDEGGADTSSTAAISFPSLLAGVPANGCGPLITRRLATHRAVPVPESVARPA